MVKMFTQQAHNFSKNGFYPTDSETLKRILSALSPCQEGRMNILDPCAGEGIALAECKQHLGADMTQAFGIEYDEKRAWKAKSRLDRCIHADMQHCVMGKRSFGLLFLNPPYGDLAADQSGLAKIGFTQEGCLRLEKLFYQLTVSTLQLNGILVLIIPVTSLDKALSHWIAHSFDHVQVFSAPEQRFKQIVLFGVRTLSENMRTDKIKATKSQLIQIGTGEVAVKELPVVWTGLPYGVPAAPQGEVKFFTAQLDAKQMAVEIQKSPCLWEQFHQRFASSISTTRPPLMSLSSWHLALSLAAGQVSGIVNATDGRTFIIKGDTHKEICESKTYEENADGNLIEITTQLDRFIPVIRAVDMTPQSATFGEVLIIR